MSFLYLSGKCLPRSIPDLSRIEKFKDLASCKYDIEIDFNETRNPREITHIKCSVDKDCACRSHEFQGVRGDCVTLKQKISVHYEGKDQNVTMEVNSGCVCVPSFENKASKYNNTKYM